MGIPLQQLCAGNPNGYYVFRCDAHCMYNCPHLVLVSVYSCLSRFLS